MNVSVTPMLKDKLLCSCYKDITGNFAPPRRLLYTEIILEYYNLQRNVKDISFIKEAQLMLSTGAMRLAVGQFSRGQQTYGTILGPLRLFAKYVTATTRHKSVGYATDTSLSF